MGSVELAEPIFISKVKNIQNIGVRAGVGGWDGSIEIHLTTPNLYVKWNNVFQIYQPAKSQKFLFVRSTRDRQDHVG